MRWNEIIGGYPCFRKAVPVSAAGRIRVTHPCAGRHQRHCCLHAAPRLACVKPVASVHPEPGSNSSLYKFLVCFLSRISVSLYSSFTFSICIDGSYQNLPGKTLSISLSALVLLLFVFSSLSMNSFLSASGVLPKADAKVRTFSSYPNFSTTFLQLFFLFFSPRHLIC